MQKEETTHVDPVTKDEFKAQQANLYKKNKDTGQRDLYASLQSCQKNNDLVQVEVTKPTPPAPSEKKNLGFFRFSALTPHF